MAGVAVRLGVIMLLVWGVGCTIREIPQEVGQGRDVTAPIDQRQQSLKQLAPTHEYQHIQVPSSLIKR